MYKYLLSPLAFMMLSLLSGCTTEKHYDAPPSTIVHEDNRPAADTRTDTREAAREGAREGVHDPYR